MFAAATTDDLTALYGPPLEASLVKVAHAITPAYRRLIEASPFAILASAGPEGLDCSPRGEAPGFLRIHDDTTLMLPDRRGNNRIDSLRNIARDPRVALLCLIPGSGTTLRINGSAIVTLDSALCASFAVDGQAPRSVTVISVREIYFQCARAVLRARLWDATGHADVEHLPTPGQILAAMSEERVGGESYDRVWPARAAASMW